MLVHSCLFVLLSLFPHIDYICTVLFEQINYDDDDQSELSGSRCLAVTAIGHIHGEPTRFMGSDERSAMKERR